MSTGALPLVERELDEEPGVRAVVDRLIQEEIERSGGHEKLLAEYEARISGDEPEKSGTKQPPEPLKAIDLKRYQLPDVPDSKVTREMAENACVVVEYERWRQTNLLLAAQVGPKAWKEHAEKLEGEAKRARMDIETKKANVEMTRQQREETQQNAKQLLDSYTEKWGTLTYSAAMLRGALGIEGSGS